jgi:DNA-binding transcriptional MerR regulator
MAVDFDDGKDAGALRTIGELGEALGIKAHVLRYWEDQFPSLQPLKRSGGRRYYRPEDVALVREIDRLVNREGYTLRGARTALKDFRMAAVEVPADRSEPHVEHMRSTVPSEVIAKLRAIRATLAGALAR